MTTSPPTPRPVRIRYRRPPDRVQVFHQTLVHDDGALVTYLPRAGVTRSTIVDGHTVLEAESPIVWFTFPGQWHDVGRFHTPDGRFTGFYANILTPVELRGDDEWRTTDLFLDVFVLPDGSPHVLDRDELEEARREGWIDAPTAERAEAEAARLVRDARAGTWPPPITGVWTLERARSAAAAGRAGGAG